MTGNYYLEYRYIPSLIKRIKAKEASPNILADVELWKEELGKEGIDINWNELSVEKIHDRIKYIYPMTGPVRMIGNDYYVYSFPTVKEAPEAKYGIVKFICGTPRIEYYTFESDMNGGWCIGKLTDGTRKNKGQFSEMTKEEFLNYVKKQKKPTTWKDIGFYLIVLMVIALVVWVLVSDFLRKPIIGNFSILEIIIAIVFAPILIKQVKRAIEDYRIEKMINDE